jgi:hypothetical protein
MNNQVLDRDALEAAKYEYATVLGLKKMTTPDMQISKITADAIEAAIIMYLIRDKRLGDII